MVIVPFSGMMVRTLKLPTSNLRTHKNNIARRFGGTEVVFFVAREKSALKIDPNVVFFGTEVVFSARCYERSISVVFFGTEVVFLARWWQNGRFLGRFLTKRSCFL